MFLIAGTMIWYIYKNYKSIEEIGDYKNNSNIPQPVTQEVQSLIDLQSEKWPKALLEINCLELTTDESKEYCWVHQKIIQEIYEKYSK